MSRLTQRGSPDRLRPYRARMDEARVRPLYFKLVALVSLMLWFGVGAAGRWIGFSG
jgi:hypothetical protein